MAASREAPWTYRQLVQPIPPKLNLSNVAAAPVSSQCSICRHLLLRGRSNIRGKAIPVREYQVVDAFPDFQALQTSAAVAGCSLCRLLRKLIMGGWGTDSQPMLESGVTALTEEDDAYEPLFSAAWGGMVKVHGAQFRFSPFGGSFQHQQKFSWNEVAGTLEQEDGIVVGLSLELGPATVPLSEDGDAISGEIGMALHFTVYDSVGT